MVHGMEEFGYLQIDSMLQTKFLTASKIILKESKINMCMSPDEHDKLIDRLYEEYC